VGEETIPPPIHRLVDQTNQTTDLSMNLAVTLEGRWIGGATAPKNMQTAFSWWAKVEPSDQRRYPDYPSSRRLWH
jgi:hypothetical protein